MKFDLKVKNLDGLVQKVNSQHVVVSVPDAPSAIPDKDKPLKRVDKHLIRPRKAGGRGESMFKILGWLEDQRQVLSKALPMASKAEKELIAKLFIDGKGREIQLERLCVNLVRKPILGKKFGKNKPSTVEDKGFDHYEVNTGKLIKSLEGKYKR